LNVKYLIYELENQVYSSKIKKGEKEAN